MKHCPHCRRVYDDAALKFCRFDGTVLVLGAGDSQSLGTMRLPEVAADSEPTALLPPALVSGSFAANSLANQTLPRRRVTRGRQIDSLAVLPLVNAVDDAQLEYLAEGITDSVINCLSRLPKLRVVPRSTMFRYKGADPQLVGRELGVRAVLAGRMLQVGGLFVVTAELIDVWQEAQVWGEQFRREPKDIFTLQEELAQDISERLRPRLSGEAKKKLKQGCTANTDAYHSYLKGRFYANKRTTEWIEKGIAEFRNAIRLDPDYALAYAGLADAYALMGSSTGERPPTDWYPQTQVMAHKALEIEPDLAEAHTSLGFYHLMYEWNFPAAERSFKRAIELNPNYANAHDGYSFYLKATGQHERSVNACQQALKADPVSLFARVSLGWAYYFARRYDKAVEQHRKALEMDPSFPFAYWNLGLSLIQKGEVVEAVDALEHASQLSSGGLTMLAHLGYAYGVAGRKDKAERVLRELKKAAATRFVSSYYPAIVHLGLGAHEQMAACLSRAFAEHCGFLAFLKVEPMFDAARDTPQMKELQWRIDLAN
jgi:TolB-like protein/Tfp pilus assembly protein PilF